MLKGILPERLVMLVRHAESEKNIQDFHGHSDLDHPLTPDGISYARDFGRRLLRKVRVAELVASRSLSARQTASVIAESHQCAVQVRAKLHAVGMGVIAGLTDSEVKAQFPAIHKQLGMFQEGLLHPKLLDIPGRESFMAFAARIFDEMSYLSDCPRPLLVVAHHSSLNMLMHVAAVKDSRFDTAHYQRYRFANLSVTLVEVGGGPDPGWRIRDVALNANTVEEW